MRIPWSQYDIILLYFHTKLYPNQFRHYELSENKRKQSQTFPIKIFVLTVIRFNIYLIIHTYICTTHKYRTLLLVGTSGITAIIAKLFCRAFSLSHNAISILYLHKSIQTICVVSQKLFRIIFIYLCGGYTNSVVHIFM